MLLPDIRYGVRMMTKNPGFTAVAVLTVALGIGANIAIFSLVNAIVLRPLPYPNPQQLVGLGQWRNQQGEGYIQTGVSAPNALDIAKSGAFQQVAYYRWAGLNITEGDRPERVDGIKASADLLPMFAVQPLIGRFLRPDEMDEGHDDAAVIGFPLWQKRYGSDPAILGKTIELNQKKYTIVGVMPASFRFTWDQEMGVFIPLVLTAEERSEIGRGTSRDLQTQARLSNGVAIEQAQARMNVLASALAAKYPAANQGWGFKVEPLHDAYHRQMATPLAIMLSAVLMVLLIACANVANLLLARATGRKREMAIRVSVGASRARLLTQLLTESLLLALSGGFLGLLFGYASDRLLTLTLTRYHLSFPNARIIGIDWRVALFSLAITIFTGVIFGLAPAWTTVRAELSNTLKETGLSTTADHAGRRLRNALVICEMALALVLLTGAGLLVRTFLALADVDLGIDANNVLTMGINLPDYKYPTPSQHAIFYRDLLQSIKALPGVTAVGAEGGGANVFFQPQGQATPTPGHEPTASYKMITPDLLRAMGTRLVAGREFNERDNEGATPVALISETVARRYWPHSSPIGQHLTVLARVYSGQNARSQQALQIVGVVKDVRNEDLWRPEPALYVPFAQKPESSIFLVIRTSVPPLSLAGPVRNAVLSLDNQQPVNRIQPMSDLISQTYGAIRFPMTLLWIFSALAFVLSAIGIFGVMSYTVSRRSKEMAIRKALGASRAEMLSLVLREGLGVALVGVFLGIAGALALSRVMTNYVYGISATDPLTFSFTAILLTAVALLASYIPARRAAKVDPMLVLRYE